ncbi:serine protease inhibitor 4-like isoform X1 [Acyrthosiphon pisum]|uniref:Serpin domain-containing protein n=2 Tax=Acyrthosiphon pisum TaxID=7029 RepID=A0A8R2D3K7_ACYPI|nr:serine protease inhibitor 4-like [Acyrthosiphon pisum]XP_016659816.1 serine protease inhibitor 4-like isoform X1 [Acyrthosiphon pisum]|eukprot:NP_001156102.2 serine protease inhibitor 4-like [Acyrthosiphon pisum]
MDLSTNLEALRSANHDFSFSLYKEVAKTETGNIFYSPFSIHVIMFIASIGAVAKTFDEMVATIHLNETTYSLEAYRQLLEELTNENDKLKLATGTFVDTAYNVKDSFVENSRKYLKSSSKKLNFKNDPERQRQYLNDWVLNETNNKIKDVFPTDSINHDTALVLANAVYFKSAWAHQFTRCIDGSFYVTPSNEVAVKMMIREHGFQYYHDDLLQFTALELPYENHSFKMIILLPDAKDGLNTLENNFSKINLHEISKNMTQHYIRVKLPSFKLEQSLQLKETLSNLGSPTMFTRAANFSNIVEDGNIYASKVVHKAYIDVNQYGTEAAAITKMEFIPRRARSYTDFIVDHPFMFFISTRYNTIIFVGRMTAIIN